MSAVYDLMFASEALEMKFRQFADRKVEIGGYFLVKTVGFFTDRQSEIYQAVGSDWLAIIQSWIVAPNQHANPEHSYRMADIEVIQDVAYYTANSQNLKAMHFHSHPSPGEQRLSMQDILFMNHWCVMYRGFSEAALVTSRPLRVINHGVEYETNGSGDQAITTKRGAFISWKDKRLRDLRGKS